MNLRHLIRQLQRIEHVRGDLPVRVCTGLGELRDVIALCGVAGTDGHVEISIERKRA